MLVDDVDLRPLAYSIQFGELDAVRTESILGRAAPDAARDALFGHGIRNATEPVRIPAHPPIGMEARVCIPILRGGRRLGFLWLIEDPPVSDEDVRRAREAASAAAAILQSEADTQLDRRRREQELILALLGPDAHAAADAAAVLEADHYVPPRPLVVCVGTGSSPRRRARPLPRADPGQARALRGGRRARDVHRRRAGACAGAEQLAEALRSVQPAGEAAHVGEGARGRRAGRGGRLLPPRARRPARGRRARTARRALGRAARAPAADRAAAVRARGHAARACSGCSTAATSSSC